MNEREEEIERLFHDAFEKAENERVAFVERTATDPGIAREVLDLLGHHRDSDEVLDASPATEALIDEAEPLPERIGDYRVERQLGRGGFGVVYLAEQEEPVRRLVALKVIKRGMDTEEIVQRFEGERQVLALLDHPGVAKVYDAGVAPDGRPFFAMEYVPGVPLSEYCDTQRLDTEARLRLFVEVCEAVQHAHQKGVLHRDLKPTNILVRERDGKAAPVVIDFGLAKATGPSSVEGAYTTRAGILLGTPEFASPEQLRSDGVDVDTRTDVYSLGVVLYHLLTGVLPIESRDLAERGLEALRQAVFEVTPPLPSRRLSRDERGRESAILRSSDVGPLRQRLEGDLDLITMKALEKERGRRYGSASELADDIGRHLHHEPVVAAPPEVSYRVRKFVRRNRGAVLAGIALASTLVLGLVGSTTGWLQAIEQRNEAQTARADAEEKLRIATAIQAHLDKVLSGANPWARSGIEELARETRVADVLALASEEADQAFRDLPVIEGEVRRTIGENLRALGLLREAEPELRRALELLEGELGPDHPRTAHARGTLAMAAIDWGLHEEALELVEETVAWYRAFEPDNFDSLYEFDLMRGQLLVLLDRFEEGRVELERIHSAATETLGEGSRLALKARFDLAALAHDRGETELAVQLMEETYDGYATHWGPDDPEALNALIGLGGTLAMVDRDDEAIERMTLAVEGTERVLGEQHPMTLVAISNLGQQYQRVGDYAAAEPLLERAVRVGSEVRGADHPHTLDARINLGILVRRLGRLEEAEAMMRSSRDASIRVNGPDSLDTAAHTRYHSYALYDLGLYDEAEASMRRVTEIHDAVLGPESHVSIEVWNMLGLLYVGMSRFDAAEEVLLDTLERGFEHLAPGHPTVAETFQNLITLRQEQGLVSEQLALEEELANWIAEGAVD